MGVQRDRRSGVVDQVRHQPGTDCRSGAVGIQLVRRVDDSADGSVCNFVPARLQVESIKRSQDLGVGCLPLIPQPLPVLVFPPEPGPEPATVITGTVHLTPLPDGGYAVTATGRNTIIVHQANGHPAGLFLTQGTFSWTLNSNFTERTLFSGNGTVADVCQLLAP